MRPIDTIRQSILPTILSVGFLMGLACSGGGGPITPQQSSSGGTLAIELRELAAEQNSPVIQIGIVIPPTGASSTIPVRVRAGFRVGFEDSAVQRLMRAAAGTTDFNNVNTIVQVPPSGLNLEFFWDALEDLDDQTSIEDVIVRVGLLEVSASDPREAVCDVEPVITVNFGAIAVCPSLAPRLDGSTLAEATIGESYTASIEALGGEEPVRYFVLDEDGQPNGTNLIGDSGLLLNQLSGAITGTVDEGTPAIVEFNVRAVDDCGGSDGESPTEGQRASQQLIVGGRFDHATFRIPVVDGEPVVCEDPAPTINDLPIELEGEVAGTVGEPLAPVQFTATGGQGALTWSASGLPAGLSLDTNGLLSGTPAVAGALAVTISVSDSCAVPQTASRGFEFDMACGAAPTFFASCDISEVQRGGQGISVDCFLGDAFLDTAYEEVIVSTMVNGVGTITLTEGTLPTGIAFTVDAPEGNTLTARISGTATVVAEGDQFFAFTLTATDACPDTAIASTRTFGFFLNAPDPQCPEAPPAIGLTAGQDLPDATETVPYSFLVPVTDGTPPVTLAVAGTNAPFTLSIDDDGRTLLANPPAGSAGTYSVTLQATDSCVAGARTNSVLVNLPVIDPCATLTLDPQVLPNATIDAPYNFTLVETGGEAPFTWSLESGTLPLGLSLNADGSITGTPSSGQTTGPYNFRAQVSDACSIGTQTASQDFVLTLDPAPVDCGLAPTITTTGFPNPVLNQPYNQPIDATDGLPPYTWSLLAGSLPVGMSVDPAGFVTGTPTDTNEVFQDFTFTVQVADACPDPGPQLSSEEFTFTLDPDFCPTVDIVTTSLPDPALNQLYSQTLQADSGFGTLEWTLAGGSLPFGLTLNLDGTITGVPTDSKALGECFEFTAQVDRICPIGGPSTDTQDFSVTLQGDDGCPPFFIPMSTLPDVVFGRTYEAVLHAAGVAPIAWALDLTSDPLPPGLTLDPAGRISGMLLDETLIGASTDLVLRATDDCLGTPRTATFAYVLPFVADANCTGSPPAGQPQLRDGGVGVPYFDQLLVDESEHGPYYFRVLNTIDPVPPGLIVDLTGRVTGTPLAPASAEVAFEAINACGQVATTSFTINILGANACGEPFGARLGDPETVPDPIFGVPYTFTLDAQGGTAPYTWILETFSDPLPAGLALNGATGEISGTPTGAEVGAQIFIRITDSCGTGGPINQQVLVDIDMTVQQAAATCPLPVGPGINLCVSMPAQIIRSGVGTVTIDMARQGRFIGDTSETNRVEFELLIAFDQRGVVALLGSEAVGPIVPLNGVVTLSQLTAEVFLLQYVGPPIVQNGTLATFSATPFQLYGCAPMTVNTLFGATAHDTELIDVSIQQTSFEVVLPSD